VFGNGDGVARQTIVGWISWPDRQLNRHAGPVRDRFIRHDVRMACLAAHAERQAVATGLDNQSAVKGGDSADYDAQTITQHAAERKPLQF